METSRDWRERVAAGAMDGRWTKARKLLLQQKSQFKSHPNNCYKGNLGGGCRSILRPQRAWDMMLSLMLNEKYVRKMWKKVIRLTFHTILQALLLPVLSSASYALQEVMDRLSSGGFPGGSGGRAMAMRSRRSIFSIGAR